MKDFVVMGYEFENEKAYFIEDAPKRTKVKSTQKSTVGTRSRESIKGLERKLIDQYNPEPEIWRSEIETRKWAEENRIPLYEIPYWEFDSINEILEKILKTIRND